ncbi:hypothetical protein CTEN210_15231 [Chaetoceros tenuissimus]|uniref:Methyltransferase type 11 domain-containing protein n=1 Tax=Chaetoceros tenuissimus TaxID=426638 RepID=A0AAD3D8I0_9STRA|nr:hypothetical protein CTEN210_15231 [Chaetoceros tenuissimus]
MSLTRTSNIDDSTGKCVFGIKKYWDDMYNGNGDRPADKYSWYSGWEEIKPFWLDLVPDKSSQILVAGIGNDIVPVQMFDEGWNNMIAFDYSDAAVERAKTLFSDRNVNIFQADARDLPLNDGSIDTTFDKGTLDAIYIHSIEAFKESISELERVTVSGGKVVSISNVIPSDVISEAFDENKWETIHDGGLAFAENGGVTIDLGANLYSWRRRK